MQETKFQLSLGQRLIHGNLISIQITVQLARNDFAFFQVFDASRKVKDNCTKKKVKCMAVVHGKIYAGCKDSSIQVG